MTAFLGGPLGGGATAVHGAVTPALVNTTANVAGINSMFSNQTTQNNAYPTKPKAFINYILFDEQFKAIDFRSSMIETGASRSKQHHADLTNIAVPKNGYVYIYCSNESPVNVFFDNLQVIHTKGPIVEETHYYPFGLTMAGINSKGLLQMENLNRFNGILATTDFELNQYEAFYRILNPQIGRWLQIDPKSKYWECTYTAMQNNPLLQADFFGDEVTYADDETREMVQKFTQKERQNSKGKWVTNKSYNEKFAKIISRMEGVEDKFLFQIDKKGKKGDLNFDGTNINVVIANPGEDYGTKSGFEGTLFEETKHAEQFLDGKISFGRKDTQKPWMVNIALSNEVEAKEFVYQELSINTTYKFGENNLNIPTQMGYLKNYAKTYDDKMNFLKFGAQVRVWDDNNKNASDVQIPPSYPSLQKFDSQSFVPVRTKTENVYVYPRAIK